MKFSKVEINNFRQYYNTVKFDLSTDSNRNIVLIGGKNGYGKTNLLISIVWCLYGKQLEKVDNNFKQEIKKEKNYDSFMIQSLNWSAKKENIESFSVSITVTDFELPELDSLNSSYKSVIITRSFNVNNMNETITIIDSDSKNEIVTTYDDKINFINDYIIPIDAAKFVFFDAEKISEIANLSIKDEGSFINDALGKILGLDTYNTLIEDIDSYINTLKKAGATKNLKEQIIDKEKAIELYTSEIEGLEEENAEKQKEIDSLKKEIREYDKIISQHSRQSNSSFNREIIISDIERLKEKKSKLSEKFNELSEVIPLAILTGKLEEIIEHINIQESNLLMQNAFKENSKKIENFIELLFNKPPEPENSTMSFKDKLFYYDKAKQLGSELFTSKGDYKELDFEHDLSNAEKGLIYEALNLVNEHSRNSFEIAIEEFNEVQTKLSDLNKTLSKVDADLEDEIIIEYTSKKEASEYQTTINNRSIGEQNQKIKKLKEDINRLNQQLVNLRNKVEINNKNKLKIEKSHKFINVLRLFLEEQKNNHKANLETTILRELKTLMHKLGSSDNTNKFIEDVEVTILASGQGMRITLLDQDDNEIRKESLSSGEKQIYISCLIKAILNESVQSLPIFIDTPLGRLDEEHRDNIANQYYPNLSEQVVLFSTNSEITPKRYKNISKHISKSYMLQNDGANTKLKNGYFNSTNND